MTQLRQGAFVPGPKLLKGALHVHTTRSDGHGTPEEVTRLYKQYGFDFMALTDHNIYNYTNFAPETGMTILPGVERDSPLPRRAGRIHTFHAVCLGPAREDGNGYEQDERFAGGIAVADQFAFQPILDDIHAHNNLTIYCHPEWSGTPARDFDQLRGNFAMEIFNSGTAMEDDMDTNAAYWDELLMQGQRIWGVATDDGHSMDQHGNGWVNVRAENSISAILAALAAGDFYSSCGPEIYDFYVQDGMAVLECSPCAYAGFRFGQIPNRLTHSKAGDVTRATYEIPESFEYIRGIVKDTQGRRAWTNPIFLK